MSREDPQFKLRMTEDLKAKVEEAAKANNRSMNAEIVARLEGTFPTKLPEHEVLLQLYEEHRRELRRRIIATVDASHPRFRLSDPHELPDTPEELAALVEARVRAEREQSKVWARINKLFSQTDEILRARQAGIVQPDMLALHEDPTPESGESTPEQKRTKPKRKSG